MKEPLYPVEITQEVLKELENEKMYHVIYADGSEDLWSGAWIKGGNTHKIGIIYLPLSSTPFKQLSEITDEDAIEVAKILKIDGKLMPDTVKIVKVKAYFDDFCLTAYGFETTLKVIQYLQFKGYNVPQYYPVSVSPLKEEKTSDNIGYVEGVYGYKTSIHNSNLSPQSDHINPIELLEWTQSQGWNLHAHYDNSEMLWSNDYTEGILTTSQLIETFKNKK